MSVIVVTGTTLPVFTQRSDKHDMANSVDPYQTAPEQQFDQSVLFYHSQGWVQDNFVGRLT